jgi:dTDP-3-amino-3,4,6-trideoxy-alpha-D-glucose transaminase
MITSTGASSPAAAGSSVSAQIPFVRLDGADPELMAELMRAVEDVAARGAFTLGPEVERFERAFADFCGAPDAIGVGSGTEALVLALRALGIGPGDEVVVPANSFFASAEAVSLVGATPKLVDVDPATGLLNASILESNIGPRTRCVIPVHLYGATVDMAPIVTLARDAGIAVVEDTCQAHGAELPGGGRAGTVGDFGCYSFYPTKNLGGWGDGGAVVTSNPELAEQLRLLRSHGESPSQRNRHRLVGTTARLDALQAALLSVKLRRLEGWNARRRELAARLTEALAGSSLELPVVPEGGDHVFHLYVVQTDERDRLREDLAARGVASAVHYPVPIHLTEAYEGLGMGRGSLPVVEERAGRICSLPLYPSMTSAELDRLAEAVLEVAG